MVRSRRDGKMSSCRAKQRCSSSLLCGGRCNPCKRSRHCQTGACVISCLDMHVLWLFRKRVFSVSCMSAPKQAAVMMWQVGHLVAELSERGELPETAEEVGLHPNVHRKLWRYVWLLDQVRSAPLM